MKTPQCLLSLHLVVPLKHRGAWLNESQEGSPAVCLTCFLCEPIPVPVIFQYRHQYDLFRGLPQVTHCRTPTCIQRVQQCSANEATFDTAACKKHYPDAYAITYWAHTWGDDPGSAKAVATRKAKVAAEKAASEGSSQVASVNAVQAVNHSVSAAVSQPSHESTIQSGNGPVNHADSQPIGNLSSQQREKTGVAKPIDSRVDEGEKLVPQQQRL